MLKDLVLSRQIRCWVFLPLFFVSFMEGILMHYISILFVSIQKIQFTQIEFYQALHRVNLLRKNGHLLTKHSYEIRRHFFNHTDNGYFIKMINRTTEPSTVHNFLMDSNVTRDILKGNLIKVIPMLIGGGWINWMFSGFLIARFPFVLPIRFKSMLQRGTTNLESLDPSWISSVSWYFLNVFGIRNMYTNILFDDIRDNYYNPLMIHNNNIGYDLSNTTEMFNQEKIKLACKIEWETLEIIEHRWLLADIVKDFI